MTLQAAEAAVLSAAPEDGFRRLAVSGIRREADGVASVILGDPDGGTLPAWEPGAHVDVLFGNGVLRQYSLCSDPSDHHVWRIAVLREQPGRGGSRYVHEELKAGDVLDVRGPKNNFRGTPGPGEKVFVAGGIGITPLLPMIRAAHAGGEPWRLLYLGSSLRSMAFLDEVSALDPERDKVQVQAKENSGSMDLSEYLRLARLGPDTTVYACGPQRLLTELRSAHAAGAIPRLMFESFGSEQTSGSGQANSSGQVSPPAGSDTPFVVETADGTEITIGAQETILDALQRVNVPALNSCRKGTCGTCETVVLGGVPDHRDEILSAEERAGNETMMICVSRCLGDRLVLDI